MTIPCVADNVMDFSAFITEAADFTTQCEHMQNPLIVF